MTIWSLTTDTEHGLDTSLYLTGEQTYEALASFWFPGPDNADNYQAMLAAINEGVEAVISWFDAYQERAGDDDRAVVDCHDHPWAFPADADRREATGVQTLRPFRSCKPCSHRLFK